MNSFLEDSITKFQFLPKAIYGTLDETLVSGQMEGVLVCIRNKSDAMESKNKLISMLEDLLRTEDIATKKSNLENKHGIKMTEKFEGRVNVMCNFSEVVFEQGIAQGKEQGMEQGIKAFVIDKIEDGIPKADVITKLKLRFQMSEEDALRYYEKFSHEL